MAIGRLSVGIGKKGKASPHAAYIAREGKYAKPDDDLEKLEFVGSGNMPKWAIDEPNFFWQSADAYERENGSTYREHVIALPRELTPDQRHDLILDWIEQELGDKHAYQYAIHNPPALDGREQPHCHLMFSERTIDSIERDPEQYFKRYNAKNPDRGGAKKANTGMKPADRKADLLAQRERWEQTCNKHLALAEKKSRISMKSLVEQGIKRKPTNFTMSQIKTPKTYQVYKNQVLANTEFRRILRQYKKIDIASELKAIKINEKLYEQADRAITATKQRVSETARDTQRAAEAAQQVLHRVNATKQLSAVTDRAINGTQRCFNSSEQLSAITDRAVTSSERAVAKRIEQQQKEIDRISKRKVSDLLRLQFRVQVNERTTKLVDTVTSIHDQFYDLYRQARREQLNVVVSNKNRDNELTNPECVGNKTARGIERFMMKKENLSNIDVLDDFSSNMSVQDFTRKYSLECDISDLKRLDELYPIEPKQTLKTANLSEPGPKNDNDRGFSM